MAKEKKNPFAKLQNSPSPPIIREDKSRVEVKTIVKKKTGRPASFDEPTSRLTADIPTTTLKAMQRSLPDSPFISQAQLVNAAILAFLEGNE